MESETIFKTVISGVAVYVFGQMINHFYIIPSKRLRETNGKIADALVFYANLYTDPYDKANKNRGEERREASDVFRKLACELISRAWQLPHYKHLRYLKKRVTDTHSNLIGLSNGMWPDHNHIEHNTRRAQEIETSLNLITRIK